MGYTIPVNSAQYLKIAVETLIKNLILNRFHKFSICHLGRCIINAFL